ncbi:MAG: hypothetical protein ABEJ86_04265 [Halococcoides sp.]
MIARDLLVRAARATDSVIEGGPDIRIGTARYPSEPTALIDTFGDHGVVLRLRYWIETPNRLHAVRSEIHTAGHKKLNTLVVCSGEYRRESQKHPLDCSRTCVRQSQSAYEGAIVDEPVTIAYPHSHLVFDDTSGSLSIDRGQHSPDLVGDERDGTDAVRETDDETDSAGS